MSTDLPTPARRGAVLESEAEQRYRARARTWLAASLPAGWGTPAFRPPETLEERDRCERAWQRTLFDGGYAGITWPTRYGGQGDGLLPEAIFREERDRVAAPEVHVTGPQLVGPMLLQSGTEDQRERYLRPILTGEHLWCQGYSEPGAGSDLAALRTRADLQGDVFVVNGQKVWTSHARTADLLLLLARTGQGTTRHAGLSVLIVPMDAPGITVRPIRQIDGEDDFTEVFLDDVRVGREALVGELDQGWRVAIAMLAQERVVTTRAFQAQRLFLELLRACQAPGPDGARPCDDGVVADVLARLYCDTHAARLNYYRAVTAQLRRGAPGAEESAGKLHTCDLVQRLTEFATTVVDRRLVRGAVAAHPGQPVDWLYEYTTARRYSISAGTAQVMRTIIGERVLGLPKGA